MLCNAGAGQLLCLQTIWFGRHLITLCCMFPGFQWRTKVQLTGWGIVGERSGLTDLCNWWAQRALSKKGKKEKTFLHKYTSYGWNSVVETSQRIHDCHFYPSTNTIACLLYQQTLQNAFIWPPSVSFSLSSPFFFPLLLSFFYLLLLSLRNCSCSSVSGPPDCIIRTCHFLCGRVNRERLPRVTFGRES